MSDLPSPNQIDEETDDLTREVDKIVDNPDRWLRTPNDEFGGEAPGNLIGSPHQNLLRDLIQRVKHGMLP
jgi:hypothetical protein